MNIDKILSLADFLDNDVGKVEVGGTKVGFNMDHWLGTQEPDKSGHHCGTTACIAGWAVLKEAPAETIPRELFYNRNFFEEGQHILGIDYWMAHVLFLFTSEEGRHLPNNKEAAEVLRYLARTERVDWPRAIRMMKKRKGAIAYL